jgi:hypothetical protein
MLRCTPAAKGKIDFNMAEENIVQKQVLSLASDWRVALSTTCTFAGAARKLAMRLAEKSIANCMLGWLW